MAYDAAAGQVILFGGQGLLEQYDDTWAWDGKTWRQLHPAHHPGELSQQSMVYDEAHHQVLLWGGDHGLYEQGRPFADTWTWDGQDWTLRSDKVPSEREGFRLAFDPGSQKVILFGGSIANQDFHDDTWTWDGTSWARLATGQQPSARYGVGLSLDPAGRLLLFGGAVPKPDAGPGEAGIPQGDTWSLASGTWTRLTPATAPPARANAAMAYDYKLRRPVIFGGNECPFISDTWAFDGSAWKLVNGGGPSPRSSAAVASDSKSQLVVLFGGLADTPCF